MKFQMTLKWRLTLGVVAVLIPMCGALLYGLNWVLFKTDDQIFSALRQRAEANAKATESEITFELAARLEDDVNKKLDRFLSSHEGAYSISVLLDPKGEPFSHVGGEINTRQIVNAFPSLSKASAKIVDQLVVAIMPVIAADDDISVAGDGGKGGNGILIYTESLENYYAFRSQVKWVGIIGSVIAIVFIMAGVYYIGHRSALPIYRLVAAAQKIADGDLERIEVKTTGSYETNQLGESIKSMAEALQKQVVAIKALTTDISSASREVAGTMAHLASSASEQAAAVTETAATVEEMEQAGKSAAGNANQIVDAAEKTTEASIRGREAVETTNAIILRIKEDSQDISDKSKNLLSAVEEVGNIIRSVNGIAEQSKILAVNASIEAAKAGEFGSGFAVVAQEVKDLAQQSKDATLQITGTLTAIRQAIETMVGTAQSGKERTEEGVNMIANAGAIMNDLSEAIRENSDFANVIATNINQQTVGLTQIATSIEEINSTALENQNISRKIVESTDQMTESFELLNQMVGRWRTPERLEGMASAAPAFYEDDY